ncbi:Amino acid ABC transporter substrate-binding protein, PAAT family [Bosea sp. 62]|uniref:transporter substrate-binding domain-containing protein n=1 Tax=unclassified Bosea (in: a-proteobacteria) TaxID=2653178 RepID=UPI00125C1E42|nr:MULTISPECIES: transporter substrate-binding domain-containing protein [unclassified Bosea (in: a-proteobacteria)]CAD5256466.1 Amino acid ABC transporter substrate-binding protein, PAAT family [Bosea sp. 46]CAD5260594.1 Amino acid ABC transporter substrate-binding protein, PAAT family [Bosea sp. 21B]CAD5280011.1 Amino acid ABC transporter substrate-binding protein, PAAT family [Bosea sp. 7B]VVT58299.1 Amino acid ABC transporter substrate-binding protein, PAAT family [Bosea sp. EC-HK365B]VXB5
MSERPIVFAYLDEPPFCWPAAGGTAQGCDVELVAAAFRALDITEFEQQLTTFAELLPGLASGRWTLTTPLFITAERRRLVDFGRPVWALADGLLVRSADHERLTGYRAIAVAGARLVVVGGQVQEQAGLAAGIAPERMIRVATQEEAVAAVRTGQADAYASVSMAHRGYLAREPDAELAIVKVPDSESTPAAGAFAFGKQHAALRERLNTALESLIGSGWHRTMMVRHGFLAGEY